MKKYNVYRAEVSGGPYDQIATIADSEYTDDTVKNGTTYYYIVTAVDESDNESDNSAEVSSTSA